MRSLPVSPKRPPVSAGTVFQQIRRDVELGFSHLVFHAPGPDRARFLRLYAERVLPRLRAAFGGREL